MQWLRRIQAACILYTRHWSTETGMAFIDYVPYDDAPEELKRLYEQYGGADRTPANIVRIAGLNPKAMAAHVDFYRAIQYGPSPLSRQQRELIAVTVSALNKCRY